MERSLPERRGIGGRAGHSSISSSGRGSSSGGGGGGGGGAWGPALQGREDCVPGSGAGEVARRAECGAVGAAVASG